MLFRVRMHLEDIFQTIKRYLHDVHDVTFFSLTALCQEGSSQCLKRFKLQLKDPAQQPVTDRCLQSLIPQYEKVSML